MVIFIIIAQSLMVLQLAAMDMQVQLNQRIYDKDLTIEYYKDKRYIVEFVTFFAARSIQQPYAGIVTTLGIVGICYLTERIEEAIEDKNMLKMLRNATFARSLPDMHYH